MPYFKEKLKVCELCCIFANTFMNLSFIMKWGIHVQISTNLWFLFSFWILKQQERKILKINMKVQPISTKQKNTSHLKSLSTKKTMEIQIFNRSNISRFKYSLFYLTAWINCNAVAINICKYSNLMHFLYKKKCIQAKPPSSFRSRCNPHRTTSDTSELPNIFLR